jgi:WD40 repeat protein/serine/threonine protein kinase
MNSERWQQIKAILDAVMDLDAAARDSFLAEACSDDLLLRKEVESFLDFSQQADEYLAEPLVPAQHIADKFSETKLQPESVENYSKPALTGRQIGDFIIESELGEGGFGIVYLARQSTLGRQVVIKILHTHHQADKSLIERFKREAMLASRLEHPYAAHIYDYGVEQDGLMWIAMEYVRGTPLDKLLETQGALSLERFVPLLDKICEVVHTAHENGIIHRDIKPANVMVIVHAGRLLPKLLDFGIAKGLGRKPVDNVPLEIEVAATTAVTDRALDVDTITGHWDSRQTSIRTEGMMGSPRYMAPEQWVSGADTDARTDIYALGVLTYEVVTSKLPFQESGFDLLQAHAFKPVPPLGPTFSAALNNVIKKAMAKELQDRYSTAIEYAVAFREAAGYIEQRGSLPQLDEQLRDDLMTNTPQSIAEAVANLGAARNAHQARDRMVEVFHVAVRYVGLLALACRARIGNGGKGDARVVAEALRKLRSQGLNDAEWIELSRELCLPFVNRRDAYPIPELISLFFEQGSANPGKYIELFESFLDMKRDLLHGAGSTEEQVSEMLASHLPQLGRILRALSFLSDYQLAVPRGDRAERWMGAVKTRDASLSIAGKQLESGRPILVDGEGRAMLSLWPLMQVAAPTPGAQEELFLFEGRGRHGAKLIAMPSGFELQDETLWEWFRANLFEVNEATESDTVQQREPYLGLASFTPADSDFFFGRERETEVFLNRLRVQPLLVVVGASGAGKSSFVQAGVIPGLPNDCRAITVRPGPAPLATLTARLLKEGIEVHNLRLASEHNLDALGEGLRAFAELSGKTLVLIVDQFEELFTLCLDQVERQLYSEGLARAARSAEDPVRVVLTLRDDFLVRAKEMPGLRERLTQGLEILTTPLSEDLIRIISEPARRAGYEFEDQELPREIVQAVAGQPGALPLLAFTAAKLWELRDRQFKQLPRRAYEGMGGVGGALAQHAEAMMGQMSQEEQRLVREVFRQLVTSEGTRAVLTRSELAQVLGSGSHGEAVLERLIGARLLVASEAEGGVERIEVIHEALLSAWPRLVKWRQEDTEGARLRDQLRAAARQWEERGHTKGLLWRDEALTEYQLWHSRYPGKLTESEEAFGAASSAEVARGKRMKRFAAGIAMITLIGGLVIYILLLNQQTKSQLLELYEEQGRQELINGNPLRASVYLSEVYSEGKDSPTLRFLLAQSMQSIDAQLFSLDHANAVHSARFSPDGKRIITASGDKTAKVWDAASGKLLASLVGHLDTVRSARFSPDGKRIVTASKDKTAKVWDAASGKLLASLVGHTGSVNSAWFSSDGNRIITASGDKTAKVWDAANGKLLASLEGHTDWLNSANFSPDGNRIVTASGDKTAKVWDAANGKLLASLVGHIDYVLSANFSPDGNRIVTASGDKTAKVWDAANGKLLVSLEGHIDLVYAANFSPDGNRIVTASADKTAKVWDAGSGKLLASLEGHTGSVDPANFSPDGNRIITASEDNTAKVWDAANGKLLASLEGHTSYVNSANFSPDGNRIVTASEDKTAKVWDAASGKLLTSLVGHTDWLNSARFSPDGNRIVTASDDKTAKVWDAADGRLLTSLEGHTHDVSSAEFSPDGNRIITSSGDKTAKVWDAANGKLLASLEGHTGYVFSANFSPDGNRIVTASNDKTAKVWDAASGKLLTSLVGHTATVYSARFSPDGNRIVTASDDHNTAKVWDAASGKLLASLVGHIDYVLSANFSPEGNRIVTASADKTAKVWDAANGKLLTSLVGHKSIVNSARFSPDGNRIITSSGDKTAKVWDAANGKLLASLEGHTHDVRSAELSPDGNRIITASYDKTAKVWDVHLETRSPGKIAEIVKRRVPFRLEQRQLISIKSTN